MPPSGLLDRVFGEDRLAALERLVDRRFRCHPVVYHIVYRDGEHVLRADLCPRRIVHLILRDRRTVDALSCSTIDVIGGSRRPSPPFRRAASTFGSIEYLRNSLATAMLGAPLGTTNACVPMTPATGLPSFESGRPRVRMSSYASLSLHSATSVEIVPSRSMTTSLA